MRAFVRDALAACVLVALTHVGVAAVSADRQALIQQRQAVEREFAAESAACEARFAVTSCLEAARLKRRDALAAVQKREAALVQQERQEAARRRQEAIDARAASAPARTASAASAPSASASRPLLRIRPAPAPRETPDVVPSPAAGELQRHAQEQRAREAYDKRQREAAAHRQKVEARDPARAARGIPPAAPLPPRGVAPVSAAASR